jgi:hypothetical protein
MGTWELVRFRCSYEGEASIIGLMPYSEISLLTLLPKKLHDKG